MSLKIARSPKALKAETEIAVLQVRIDNVEKKFDDIKEDLKQVDASIQKNYQQTTELLKEMQKNADQAHTALEKKISMLEKWRWMMMGAGIVVGSMGFETLSKLFQ